MTSRGPSSEIRDGVRTVPWRDVPTSSNTIDLKKQAPGYAVEGIFKGHRTFDTQYGEQTVWEFRGKDGDFGVYGATSLNIQMQAVEVGTLTRIAYEGKKTVDTKKRGKVAMHIFKVQVNDDEPSGEKFDQDEIPA